MSINIEFGYKKSEDGVILHAELLEGGNEAELAWGRQAMVYVHKLMAEADLGGHLPDDLADKATLSISADVDAYGLKQTVYDVDGDPEIYEAEDSERSFPVRIALNLGFAGDRLGGQLEPHIQVAMATNNMLVEAINQASARK